MTDLSAGEKQAVIRQLLQNLAAAQAASVNVRLASRIAGDLSGVRGLLNPPPRPPLPPAPPPPGPSIETVRLGHELHVIVTSPRPGFLHLFNLGSSGDVRRMLPRPGEAPAALEATRAHLAGPADAAPWVERGPVNEFPERVLAVVTATARAVPASCLHPSFNDAAHVRGFSAPAIDVMLAGWPEADWSWGVGEARVEG